MRPGRVSALGLPFTVAIVAFVAAALFLPSQVLWVDETTQLSGLTLSPPEVASWLAGERPDRFPVPPDRSPPLSYWMGWAWAALFGLSEDSLRFFGACCLAAAAGLIGAAARAAFGARAGWFAGLWFALSCNAIVWGVEIRSYPLFLLTSAAAAWALCRYAVDERERSTWAWVAGGALVLGAYTHFFGAVLAGAGSVALLATDAARRRRPWVAVGVGVAVGMLSAGLLPFIFVSFGIPDAAVERASIGGVARLIARVAASPSQCAHLPVLGAGLGTALILALLGFAALRRRTAWIPVVVTLVAGIGVTVAAAFFVRSFDALRPAYSAWALPFAAVLVSAGLSAAAPMKRLAMAAAAVALVAQAAGAAHLILNGAGYSHGPAGVVADVLRSSLSGGRRVAVIHDAGSRGGHVYFPIVYTFGGSVTQLDVDADRRELGEVPEGERIAWTDPPFDRLIVISAREMRWEELKQSPPPQVPAGPYAALLATAPGWRLESEIHHPAFIGARIQVFDRNP